jgi:TonB family protein
MVVRTLPKPFSRGLGKGKLERGNRSFFMNNQKTTGSFLNLSMALAMAFAFANCSAYATEQSDFYGVWVRKGWDYYYEINKGAITEFRIKESYDGGFVKDKYRIVKWEKESNKNFIVYTLSEKDEKIEFKASIDAYSDLQLSFDGNRFEAKKSSTAELNKAIKKVTEAQAAARKAVEGAKKAAEEAKKTARKKLLDDIKKAKEETAKELVEVATEDNALNLTVFIDNEYLEIWARGGFLPKMFYKHVNSDLVYILKENEEDPGTLQKSVYSKSDSAYLDGNNEFITSLSKIMPGAVVATLAKSSVRRLACGQSGIGVEDMCTDGKPPKPAVTLRPRSVYDELAKYLIMIHDRFIDSPDASKIIIAFDTDTDNNKIADIVERIIERARNAGFSRISLAKKQHYSKMEKHSDKAEQNSREVLKMLSAKTSQTSGKTKLDGPRRSATGGFIEGGSGGIGDMLGGLMGGKSERLLKAPSARDIDMGSGNGSRSKAEVIAVVNAHMPGLRNIYNKYLELKPDLSGKVTLKFTIAPGGDIISIAIVSSTTGYSDFDNAVKNMVGTWKWKAIKSGNTTPTIPFNFTE